MEIKFDNSIVAKTIEKSKQIINKKGGGDTPIAYLPHDGNHEIKFFFSPDSEILDYYEAHKIGKKWVLCDKFLGKEECRYCDISEIVGGYQFKAKKKCRIYGHVISTNRSSEYWEAGKTYAIIGNTYLYNGFSAFMSGLFENESSRNYLNQMLNPTISGGYCSITCISLNKTKGSCNIQAVPGNAEVKAIFTSKPDWWIPLKDVYVPEEVNKTYYDNAYKDLLTLNKIKIIESGEADPEILTLIEQIDKEAAEEAEKESPHNTTNTADNKELKTKDGFTYKQLKDTGWSDAQLLENPDWAMVVPKAPPKPPAPPKASTPPKPPTPTPTPAPKTPTESVEVPECMGKYDHSKTECYACLQVEGCTEQKIQEQMEEQK